MIERLAELIPKDLLPKSGAVFYSGRAAFSARAPLYLLGLNPGGDSSNPRLETIEVHTRKVLKVVPAEWSAFCDERWGSGNLAPGTSGMQPRVLRVLKDLGLDARHVPASNLIFMRTRTESELQERLNQMAQECWPVHRAVIEELGIRVILCMGKKAGKWVAAKLGATEELGWQAEENNTGRASIALGNRSGQVVVIAPHPSRSNWQNPRSAPTDLIRKFLPRSS